ncbi:helix-turn-helix transcriptional regulator [uncultured Kordia sp.]|uniref:helix-turn-helix domain-containing protein n=1 Tax=uncultured Kordia sp. TaxID=507699 RepID=UPI0026210A5B|nr:helix-turn-helix transcriptional regulator [uncultured Kordia sp.]
MLQTIQILALIQGLFLLIVIFKNKKQYKSTVFWLFVGSIAALQLYILGDDDNNLFFEDTDLFLFDITLFATFLFLFITYKTKPEKTFSKRDLLYFIPNIAYLIIEILESKTMSNGVLIEFLELVIELTFLSYFIAIAKMLFDSKSEKWMLYFLIPMITVISFSIGGEVTTLLSFPEFWLFGDQYFNSSMIILVAFLYYSFSFKLIISPREVLPSVKPSKYKTSSLAVREFSSYQKELIRLMEKEELYKQAKLSIHDVARTLSVPRQHISEVLNVHMNVSFQDFINQYRVNAFINCLQKEQYAHYTLFGIANEVGFNSKSSFNTTFKKIKGLTPSEYKKTLLVVS